MDRSFHTPIKSKSSKAVSSPKSPFAASSCEGKFGLAQVGALVLILEAEALESTNLLDFKAAAVAAGKHRIGEAELLNGTSARAAFMAKNRGGFATAGDYHTAAGLGWDGRPRVTSARVFRPGPWSRRSPSPPE
jgi:hypothetical protein